MLIEKIIQRKIHITEHIEAFTGDKDAVVLDKLKQTLVGKCYKSCLILEILEILRVSDFVVSRHRQDASTVCSVQFKVRGLTLEKHQVIHGCVIKNIDKNNHIVAEGKNMAVYIKADGALKTLRNGQTIVAIVGNAKYTLFSPVISVNAFPFIPIKKGMEQMIFKVQVSKHSELNKYIDRLNSIGSENKTLDRKFFDDLLYPRKGKMSPPPKASIMSIGSVMDQKEGKTMYIAIPDYLSKTAHSIVVFDEKDLGLEDPLGSTLQKTKTGTMVVSEKFVSVIGSIIHEFLKYEDIVAQLCSTYGTEELRKENSNIWDIYTKYKY
jgi:hypothetical protein